MLCVSETDVAIASSGIDFTFLVCAIVLEATNIEYIHTVSVCSKVKGIGMHATRDWIASSSVRWTLLTFA